MKKKYILDCIIIALAITCIVAIVNSVRASNDVKVSTDKIVTDKITTNKTEKVNNDKIIITTSEVKGDADGDNKIGISDVTKVLSYVANRELYFEKPTEEELKVADIDGDDIITYKDAIYISKYYAMNAVDLNPTWEEVIDKVEMEMPSTQN